VLIAASYTNDRERRRLRNRSMSRTRAGVELASSTRHFSHRRRLTARLLRNTVQRNRQETFRKNRERPGMSEASRARPTRNARDSRRCERPEESRPGTFREIAKKQPGETGEEPPTWAASVDAGFVLAREGARMLAWFTDTARTEGAPREGRVRPRSKQHPSHPRSLRFPLGRGTRASPNGSPNDCP